MKIEELIKKMETRICIKKEFKKLTALRSFNNDQHYFIIGAQRALDWVLNEKKRSPSEIMEPLIKESK